MLMNEIASAADTLELWKLVNDSVWAALQRLQKEEQARKAAEKKAAAKRPPRKSARTQTPRTAAPTVPPQQRSPQAPQQQQSQPSQIQPTATTPSMPNAAEKQRLGLQHRQSLVTKSADF